MSEDFLARLSNAVAAHERRARERFGALDYAKFNWSPGPDKWSIGQCLDHLVKGNDPYFAIFDSLANGTHQTTIWQRLPLLPAFWGWALYNTIKPENTRKAKAPKIFQPSLSDVPLSRLDDFCRQQTRLMDAMNKLKHLDLETTIITSPVATFITYSLWDTFEILVAHEERHLNQAERVLQATKD